LGGTGPVGRRVAQLLAGDGANVKLTSRSLDRASRVAGEIQKQTDGGDVTPVEVATPTQTAAALDDAEIVIACGAAGVELVDQETICKSPQLKVAIDLNAVPPAGIGGIEVADKAKPLGRGVAYGAIGVGGLKMKTHRKAIESLFEQNDHVLDAAEIYQIAKSIG
ncbi:MAG: NAD(P)H-binding protein, partial [Pirellulales bacterium]|nr:NAD(P)H-binding protein [Pirellulales bacterium]